MERLLLIDDDAELTAMLASYLAASGFAVESRGDLGAARTALREAALRGAPFALAVLDLMLPDGDGLAFCRELRGAQDPALAGAGVVMLTARGDEADRVVGLELGADDYLTKPFSPRTLLARVKALLRRAGIEQGDAVAAGRVSLDLEAHALSIDGGAPVRLTRLETRLLQILVAQAGHVVSAERLLAHVWGHRGSGDRQLLKQLVHRLRQKLEKDPAGADLLHTEAGIGYRLKA